MPELYKRLYPDTEIQNYSTGFVDAHELHGKFELENNLKTAIVLAKHGYQVRLLPNINIPNRKNPDAFIVGEEIVMEFKHIFSEKANAVDKAIRDAKVQANHVLVHLFHEIEKGELLQAIKSRVKRAENIVSVWVVFGEKLYRFTRDEALSTLMDDKIQWGGLTDAASRQ